MSPSHAPHRPEDEESAVAPYVTVLLVAFVVGLALLVYVFGYRDQIAAILTQSPT